ncbi:hypothetical protein [Steroidobacter cummioxidans]|uniref:hypothetical protein n=1 Tax=Steroidobacter cummioxidans TaxID=1803913 RepID=UPI0012904127|nr:hypothetical protein [Steroidobacter cummioxidans]
MSALRDFIFAAVIMAIAGVVIPFLKKKASSVAPRSHENRATGKDIGRPLYGLFIAILVLTPAASFMLATDLDVYNRDAFVFLFMGIGVFLSLPLTLLVARLIGEDRYEKYWLYLEEGSKVGRRAILLMWVCVALMSIGTGAAMFLME